MNDSSGTNTQRPGIGGILAFIFVIVGLPTGMAFLVFYPPNLGFRIFDVSLFILSFFLVYVLLAVAILQTRRINVVQFTIFVVFSVSFLLAFLLAFAFVFRKLGILDGEGHRIFDPLTCIYFSVITWTTVGYGDFTPSPETRGYAAIEALLAYIFMAMLISGFLHVSARLRSDRAVKIPTTTEPPTA
ncbi:MAG: hypothetical protein QOI04_1564 [Verrucomicrobiota bacterium]|jgi:hypothetical protein